jgi:hypothetical protein
VQCGEVAIAADPLNSLRAVAVYLPSGESPTRAHAVVTRTGFNESPPVNIRLSVPDAPGANQLGMDPMAAASPSTGMLFAGAFSARLVFVQPIAPGSLRLGTPAVAMPSMQDPDGHALPWDKCFMAVGPHPQPAHSAEVVHVGAFAAGFQRYALSAFCAHSNDDDPAGSLWPSAGERGYPAWVNAETDAEAVTRADGLYPLVVPGGARAGRLVLAMRERTEEGGALPPMVAYADNLGSAPGPSGRRWEVGQRLNCYGPGGAPLYVAGAAASLPSAALDPGDPSRVYVCFIGSAVPNGPADLFVALGDTQADTGALTFSPGNTVRITDELIAPGEGPCEESRPSIAIDQTGGINILFRRTLAASPPPNSAVRYAHWNSFAALAAKQRPFLATLTPEHDPWIGGHFDYEMITQAGCRLYAAYPSPHSGSWDLYVRVIGPGLSCPGCCAIADRDGNGTLDARDLGVFFAAAASGDPLADVNGDGVVDASDWSAFLLGYAGAAETP